jgi:CRISPR-associated exonuclease Cas4
MDLLPVSSCVMNDVPDRAVIPTGEEEFLPLSGLQHYLFCPRQCALIHLEQEWHENRLTAEGRVMHQKAHDGPDESRPGIRITRGMAVSSALLGLSGQCDVVEFHGDGSVVPVEYKRGTPKAHRADEIQLCAQAIALEEMLGMPESSIREGRIFYGKHRRRHAVICDEELRMLTLKIACAFHRMIASRKTPPPVYAKEKCDNCSLAEVCNPEACSSGISSRAWFEREVLAFHP